MSEAEYLAAELHRLISRYGAKAVRDEAKRIGKGKAGRPDERDYWLLKDVLEMDARDWLEGRDPLAIRSNNAVASQIAGQNPGQSRDSTHRRIMRKLSEHRCAWMKVKAMWISEEERPFADFFKVAREIEALPDYAQSTAQLTHLHCQALERYRARYGEPQPTMTIRQIAEEARRPWPPRQSPDFARWLFSRG